MRQPRAAPPTVPIPPRTVEEQHFVDFDFDFWAGIPTPAPQSTGATPTTSPEEQHFVDFDFDFPLPPSLTRIPHYGKARGKCV